MTTPGPSLPTTSVAPKPSSTVTKSLLEHWFASTHPAKGNCVAGSTPSVRARSSARKTVPGVPSKLEAEFALQLRAHAVTGWTREYRPLPTRRFRLDFAFPTEKVGIELSGGTWSGGRHTRGKGYDTDCEKWALLQLAGWTVIVATSTHLKDGSAMAWTKQALGL